MARERMTNLEMVAECLREIGVLVLVFGFLDLAFEATPGTTRLTPFWVAAITIVSLSFGFLFERIRRE